ncbi:hypothetical protein SAMN05660841_00113 [Sphingobacterium nematocida]|uniref:Glycosyltransferase n=1 Tax=Sphingobacterium nematocida TaxID=1513896 RepID=A0A1T5AS43_9SPHI|nr:hypothetical protein [Sphingobacterium nematocida]SKB37689.1 hypothetical protein SAMN05660841_00113 [Sphingobacterium nematocida]
MKQEVNTVDSIFELGMLQEIIPELPAFDLSHIRRMTNQVSIVQHATYSIPNYKHGYCLDDTARALLLTTLSTQAHPSNAFKDLTYTYLAYIHYMQRDCGRFRNLLSFDHQFLDEYGTEDSYGRTLWALGHFLRYTRDPELVFLAEEILHKALPHCVGLKSVKAVSYTLLGLQHYYAANRSDDKIIGYIKQLSSYLLDEYKGSHSPDWYWYEQILSYDNAVIPLAVLRSGILLKQESMITLGRVTATFLDSLIFEKGYLSTIGNESWYVRGSKRSIFAQQPIEVPSSILLYKELFGLSGDSTYKRRMVQCLQWFFGKNELGIPLYDPVTKGCCDGLERFGLNLNQGAESSISFWQAYLYVCYSLDD